MEKIPFILKELKISKMPGFPRGLSFNKRFSPNINIIAGPNASGKSSTAHMIKQIIWRNNTQRLQANAVAEMDNETWQIHIDSRHVQVQRKGEDAELTGLPSDDARDRYMLALHELVSIDEEDIASEIVRQSVGGYDLEQARKELGYNESMPRKQVKEFTNYQDADDKYKEAFKIQKDLKQEEERLKGLYREKEDAHEASKLKEFYKLMKDWLLQNQKYEQIKKQYDAFPAVMSKLSGEELENINGLEKEIADARGNIEKAEEKTEICKKELAQLNIPETGVKDEELDLLEDKISQLEKTERDIGDIDGKIQSAGDEEKFFLRNLGKSLDYENWKGINLEDVTNLHKFLDEAIRTYSEKQFLETELNNLQREPEREIELDGDKLKKGINALSSWLRGKTTTGISGKWLWILAVAGGVTAIGTLIFGVYGLLALPVLVFLAIYAYKSRSSGEVDLRKEDYLQTGLEAPEVWDIRNVTEKMDDLSELLGKVRYKDKIEEKIKQWNDELNRVQLKLETLEEQHRNWENRLKAAPDLPKDDVKNFSGLSYFLDNVKKWQEKHAERIELEGKRRSLEEHCSQLKDEINKIFTQYSVGSLSNASGARAVFKKLKAEEDKRKDNTKEIENQNNILKDEKERLDEKRNKLRGIYQKLQLNEGEKEKAKNLVEQLGDYEETESELKTQKNRSNEKQNSIEGHSMYEAKKDEMEYLTIDQIGEKIEENDAKASKLEKINERITRIETNIENKKGGNELENALREREQTFSKLQGLYERNLSDITGNLIVDHLKKETQNKNQTPVLKRANELFNRITRGRYELLTTEDNGEPVFKALDTVLNVGQHLDELSTGTRIQLLLSVRLAFIETQESALKLPLLADELLANSDDARAKAIIDALVEINRDGRQVFYFTAQGDEVAKWKHYMHSVNNISYEVNEISGENNEHLAYDDYQPPFDTFELKQNDIPVPGDKSHEDYGKEIRVPSFDLLSQPLNKLHLWYLIEDPALLYNCLTNGIKYWGQLKSFFDLNGEIQGLDSGYINKLQDKVALLERFQELYSQGRPVPIDRSVLEDSGAVSENFIEPVSHKLEELNRNPQQLIRALRNGEVSRFKTSKIDELEEFLFNKGYLSEEEILDKDEILVNMQAMMSKMEVEKGEVERMIELILKRVDKRR